MKHIFLAISLCITGLVQAQQPAAEPHTFTSTDGRELTATIVGKTDTTVTIRRAEDGQEFVLPLDRISVNDQAFVKAWEKPAESAAPANGKVALEIRVIEPKWDEIYEWSSDWKWFFASRGGEAYVIHADGHEVRSKVLKDLKFPVHFGGKYWIVEQEGKQGLYDAEKDAFSIEPVWGQLGKGFFRDIALEFKSGVIWACKEKRPIGVLEKGTDWAILDFDGNTKAEVQGLLSFDVLPIKRSTDAETRGPGILFSILGKELGEWDWEDYAGYPGYHDGYVAVSTKKGYDVPDKKWGMVDYEGKVVVAPQWDYFPRKPIKEGKLSQYITEAFPSGLAAVAVGGKIKPGAKWEGGKRGFINKAGDLVIPATWDDTTGFVDGIALVKRGKLWGVISTNGEVTAQPQWEEAYLLSKRRVWITQGGKWGLANEKGEVLGKIEWDFSIKMNSRGFIVDSDRLRVTKDGKEEDAVFLSADGEVFDKPGIGLIRGFKNGFAWAEDTETGRNGFVDTAGNWLYRFPDGYESDKMGGTFNGYVRIVKDGKDGAVLVRRK